VSPGRRAGFGALAVAVATAIGLAVVPGAIADAATTPQRAGSQRAAEVVSPPRLLPTRPPSCGAPIQKANGGGPWECTFADDFTGATLDPAKWIAQTSAESGFGSQDDCYVDDPDNIAVGGGVLALTVRKEAEPFECTTPTGSYSTEYTSASLNTFHRWSQAFGRFEFRARFPAANVQGLHGALWLWPDDPLKYGRWPLSGEIDVAEVYSRFNDRAIPFLHYLTNNTTVTNNFCLLTVTDWHTYVVEWTTSTITITYDGTVCLQDTINSRRGPAPRPFDHPFMISLTEGLGVGVNELLPATPPTLPATMEVDYVRAWK
jgi:beta-glucanase (GH16 family)